MNVFFTTPYAGKKSYQKSIDAIVDTLRTGNHVITPEQTAHYISALEKLSEQGLNMDQAHYAFIRQGIATADVVVIEASHEDLRVGHELTLALLFHKPTLLLSQNTDYSKFITHDLLTGILYKSDHEAQIHVRNFLESAQAGRPESTMQTIDMGADNLHAVALAKLRQLAKQEPGQFGEWARLAETKPKTVARDIQGKLGSLEQMPAWSVFAPIYNEDSPDYIQSGVAKFITSAIKLHGVTYDDLIVEAACGTAALSRLLTTHGFQNIQAFDSSRPMLAEAFRLSTNYPQIDIFESTIESLRLSQKAKVIVWTDYSSNFALSTSQLKSMVLQLAENIQDDGLIIFDIRTYLGWQIDFYSQPVTTFATERFQRLWLNQQNEESKIIDFDVYIRMRDPDGGWSEWQRESMREKMWTLKEVFNVVSSIDQLEIVGIYGDDFRRIDLKTNEPNLAYFVLKKLSSL